MQRFWESDLEVVVSGAFLYAPLLLDPAVAAEVEAGEWLGGQADLLLVIGGRPFIKALSLPSWLDAFPRLHPQEYTRLERDFLTRRQVLPTHRQRGAPDPVLRMVIFEVMPHFIRRRDRQSGKVRLSAEEYLDLLEARVRATADKAEPADAAAAAGALPAGLARWDPRLETVPPPPQGLLPLGEVRRWLYRAMTGRIAAQTRNRLEQEQLSREDEAGGDRRESLLRRLAAREAFEIDGVGFTRLGRSREYAIFRRTGEYALKDFYGRVYLFPDCRVAVSTLRGLRPVVLEEYKHPFLQRRAAGQQICLTDYVAPGEFSAANIIAALEEGLNALLYGYDVRRRQGYHALDRLPRQERLVDFEDYLIPPDHPKLASGQVEIKNAYT